MIRKLTTIFLVLLGLLTFGVCSCDSNNKGASSTLPLEKIAFLSGRDGNSEIYIMSSDGSNQVNLSNNSDDDGSASWSANGSASGCVTVRVSDGDI